MSGDMVDRYLSTKFDFNSLDGFWENAITALLLVIWNPTGYTSGHTCAWQITSRKENGVEMEVEKKSMITFAHRNSTWINLDSCKLLDIRVDRKLIFSSHVTAM